MGVYVKKLQAKKVETIFAMLGLHIEDGDIIEVPEPHGRLIDVTKIPYLECADPEVIELVGEAPTVIEAEGE